eukprot:CAMPEP_0115357126 /NCGR_PEP_ID=MMETSP0270-20121206/99982_1 /TAXON_ID=71861 /ORGANISM="Scrippsiella trochoidea, Strain CCMP3099" /LENGTH=33 /DNA_ID= /DNA_START= /DNA_END= /DNA_ORIENTATION=
MPTSASVASRDDLVLFAMHRALSFAAACQASST